jgi:PAS domain S-box-containing protein
MDALSSNQPQSWDMFQPGERETMLDTSSPTSLALGTSLGLEPMSCSLLRIAERLNSTLEIETLLDVLIQEAMVLTGAQGGCAGLYTLQGMICHKYYQKGRVLPLEYCWPANHGLPGWLIVHRVPYLTNDALADTQIIHELCLQFGVQSALSTPILDAQGEPLGFFELHNKQGNEGFGQTDQDILLMLSHFAAIAIQNALAYQKLQQSEQALQEAHRELEKRILQRTAELAQANVALQAEVVERKQLEEQLQRSKVQLETILKTIADGILLQDATGKIIYANHAAAIFAGYHSVGELLQDSVLAYEERFEVADEQGRPFPIARFPGRRVLAGEDHALVTVRVRLKETGEVRWLMITSTAMKGSDGQPWAVMSVLHDITQFKELERRKDEFISMASHELKTPVTSIKGYTQLLSYRLQEEGDEEAVYMLGRMDVQLNQLTRLIRDLLDVSKMQRDQLDYRETLFDLATLVQETVDQMQATVETHRLILDDVVRAPVFGDRGRIGQVVSNLLANAVKYSPKADRVIVRITADAEMAVVSVQDFGIGIVEAQREHIFERYYQVSEQNQKPFTGLGLGLYICNEIIKHYHGRLWVESRKGRGSTFSFTLPLHSV